MTFNKYLLSHPAVLRRQLIPFLCVDSCRRLRSAGVCHEDRQDLLGHKSKRNVTTHYSAAELHNLIEAANKVCDRNRQGPALTLLRINREVSYANAHKMPTIENFGERLQA